MLSLPKINKKQGALILKRSRFLLWDRHWWVGESIKVGHTCLLSDRSFFVAKSSFENCKIHWWSLREVFLRAHQVSRFGTSDFKVWWVWMSGWDWGTPVQGACSHIWSQGWKPFYSRVLLRPLSNCAVLKDTCLISRLTETGWPLSK